MCWLWFAIGLFVGASLSAVIVGLLFANNK